MKTIKIRLLLLVLLLSLNPLFAQTKEQALRDAKIAANATLNENYDTILKYTLPEVIDLMGGKDAAKSVIENTLKSMASQGFKFEKADILSASEVVNEQGQYRCVVEGYNQMTMPGQRIKSKSYLLGIYNPVEQYWWFIEAKQLQNKTMLDQILPGFETALTIPKDDVKIEAIDN